MVTVSVIVPHYNRQELIVPTLESLKAQTFTDWELIVVDDASRESPHALIEAIVPGARVIRQPTNVGPAAARNIGIDAARGRFVAFLDSDDYWEPGKLFAQLTAVLGQPDPDNVFCAMTTRVIDSKGRERLRPRRGISPGERFDEFLYVSGEFAQSSSMLLSRVAASRVRFHEELRQYEDHLFFIDCGNSGLQYLLVEEPLVVWRNDARADRLGRSDSLEKGERYLAVAGDALGVKARLAFQTRFLGPTHLKKAPIQTIKTAARAWRAGAVTRKDLGLLAIKTFVAPHAYENFKSWLR